MNNMTQEEQQEYQEKMGSPEMEYLQYQMENPELLEDGTHECETDNSAGNVDADGTCTVCGKTDLI
jgi:hypothetical protein